MDDALNANANADLGTYIAGLVSGVAADQKSLGVQVACIQQHMQQTLETHT